MLLPLQRRVHDRPEVTSKMRVSGVQERAHRWRVLTVQTKCHVTVLHSEDKVSYPTEPEDLDQWTTVMESIMTKVRSSGIEKSHQKSSWPTREQEKSASGSSVAHP